MATRSDLDVRERGRRGSAAPDDLGAASADTPIDDDQSVSDAAIQRLLAGVVIVIAAAVVIGLFAVAALWAARGDDEAAKPMNAVDIGFLQDMLDHHEQALLISNLYLDNNPDGDAAPYAHEVVMFQTREIGWMQNWLAEENSAPGKPDRMAMEWMSTPIPVAEMRGMQPQERLDALAAARGAEADLIFFVLMSEHHLGGVHMADAASSNGARQEIIDFAKAVSRNQRIEVDEYNKAMVRLGFA